MIYEIEPLEAVIWKVEFSLPLSQVIKVLAYLSGGLHEPNIPLSIVIVDDLLFD